MANRRTGRSMGRFSGRNVRSRNAARSGHRQQTTGHGMSRRRFLGTAAGVGAAAVGLGGIVKATPPGSDVLKVPGDYPTIHDAVEYLENNDNLTEATILLFDDTDENKAQIVTTKSLTVKAANPANFDVTDPDYSGGLPKIDNLLGWHFYSYTKGTEWNFENVEIRHNGDAAPPAYGDPGEGMGAYGGLNQYERSSFFATNCYFHNAFVDPNPYIDRGGGLWACTNDWPDTIYMDKVIITNCLFYAEGQGLVIGSSGPDGVKGPCDINQVKVSDCVASGGLAGMNFANVRGNNNLMVTDNTCSGLGGFLEMGIDIFIGRGQYNGALFKGNKCHTGTIAGIFIGETHTVGATDWQVQNEYGKVINCVFVDNDCTWDGEGQREFYPPPSLKRTPGFDIHIQECNHNTFVKNKAEYVAFGEKLPFPPFDIATTSNYNTYIDFNFGIEIFEEEGSENNTINTLGGD
jgi:hypothetical protein